MNPSAYVSMEDLDWKTGFTNTVSHTIQRFAFLMDRVQCMNYSGKAQDLGSLDLELNTASVKSSHVTLGKSLQHYELTHFLPCEIKILLLSPIGSCRIKLENKLTKTRDMIDTTLKSMRTD